MECAFGAEFAVSLQDYGIHIGGITLSMMGERVNAPRWQARVSEKSLYNEFPGISDGGRGRRGSAGEIPFRYARQTGLGDRCDGGLVLDRVDVCR